MLLLVFLLGSGPVAQDVTNPDIGVVRVDDSSTWFTWECPDILPIENLPDGLIGYMADNCGFAGSEGTVLLPCANLFLAIPPVGEPRLEIIPEGVRYLSGGTVSSVSVSPDGVDRFQAADAGEIPGEWGSIKATGRFRRAGYAEIRLHPVIYRNGSLYTADRFLVRLNYPSGGSPVQVSGKSGSIFDALFEGGNQVWSISESRDAGSPFWGLPWYSMDIDTAGIYCVTGADIPEAAGTPSSSLSLFCGRGREMGSEPWENEYTPRPVPVMVKDGGDGIFDSDDRFYFFGRGLAWWEPEGVIMPAHYNHRYCSRNTYWLTWGGEDGARMNIQNGELTGAPAMPDSFLSRRHFEQNLVRTVEFALNFPDDWAWTKSEGTSDTSEYFTFDANGARGSGYLRLCLTSNSGKAHHVRIFLNSTMVCDTIWAGIGLFTPTIAVDGILDTGNRLKLTVIRESGADRIFFGWFEVFSWTGNSLTGQSQVPLEWWASTGRQEFTWANDIKDALVFLVSGDTLADNISIDNAHKFEFEIPVTWKTRELWISDPGNVSRPAEIRYESPGRIMETMDGAECLFVAADEFYNDIIPLTQAGGDLIAVSASEVYNEFNGGVRDPRAIQAMSDYIVDSWKTIPEDLVLVGGGTWDPLNYVSARKSYIDVLKLKYSTAISDDVFSMVRGSDRPQIAVSRIGISNRSDLQMLVDRSLSYGKNENSGQWQTVVLGAADDERYPLSGGDETIHTESVERLLTRHLPDVVRPEKLYMIFYKWDTGWRKPLARADYIDLWSKGALISLYLGHGAYDQLADEGLLYLEDIGILACEHRLPFAMFGSCNVGQFQNPSTECLGQQVTTSLAGGAILGLAATDETGASGNEVLFASILDNLFDKLDLSVGMCVLLGKINNGYNINAAKYALFGDGNLQLAFPRDSFDLSADTLFSGETATLNGTAPSEGILFVEAYESCQPDTYITFRQHIPIDYLSIPGRFYSGTAYAEPGFNMDMFVPIDSDTGVLARTQVTFINGGTVGAASTYPAVLRRGNPLQDTAGPVIELWIDGYRNVDNPEISGDITVRAVISDSSGINLLGNVGRQLALYVDGVPDDVSSCFQYNTGSATTGELETCIGELEPGSHSIELRASDGLLNSSSVGIEISVTNKNSFEISKVFPYPNPCADGTSINWTQSSPGRVNIDIFTVAGRRIVTFGNIEGSAGYNQRWWDLQDADGDAVSSGTYIFVVSAASSSDVGENSRVTGIVAVVRNS